MSYAHATGSGNGNNQEQRTKRYLNDKMIQCHSNGVSLEKLVEVPDHEKLLPQLTALQKVKYGVMYALASENKKLLEDLVIYGLEVDGKHLTFKYHKANLINVYISNIPYGISRVEISAAFSKYGIIKGYCLTKISIRQSVRFPASFLCLSFPAPFFVHCPYKGRINRAESVLTGLKPY